jgi:hypothetical protein
MIILRSVLADIARGNHGCGDEARSHAGHTDQMAKGVLTSSVDEMLQRNCLFEVT